LLLAHQPVTGQIRQSISSAQALCVDVAFT